MERKNRALNSWKPRSKQKIPSGKWKTWLILAGRGFGKTRTGAETIKFWAKNNSYKTFALIGNTYDEVEQIMLRGISGLLTIDKTAVYSTKKKQIQWPNGAIAYIFTAHAYEKMRGYQLAAVWLDELAKFKDPASLWKVMIFALRAHNMPRIVVTTTPKPIQLLIELIKNKSTHLTRGSTMENKKNLPSQYIKYIQDTYGKTSYGKQEIYGQILFSREALWNHNTIVSSLLAKNDTPEFVYTIISVDPAVSCKDKSDETGIIVMSQDLNNKIYILADLSGKYTVNSWGERIAHAYKEFKADKVVVEKNNGGDLIKNMLHHFDENIVCEEVVATKSKMHRAHPVALMYHQNKIFHTQEFPLLEEQMLNYHVNSFAKDRVDALVWGITILIKKRIFDPQIWMI